ncbi:type 1 fimbrial protein [Lelliottia amnigena]|uniref:fimbrial protein n=1 Tax=Lelliottia amnigena TaxID=61646 RepID=UPI001F3CF113|nr:fimbrial protein [Lelliottia amnigena]UJD93797.1 type 1 fimbrial protein [Lelliottia amnigena]
MFNVKKMVLASTLTLIASTTYCQSVFSADQVTINITGNVVASPCQVNPDSANINIDLGQDLQSADLNAAGSSSAWKPINVVLENCPAGTSSVTATFNGTPDADDPESLYTNTGTANQVAVQLEGLTEEKYGNGKTSTIDIASVTDGKPTWKLQTRAFSKNGSVTPGTINSVVTMSFTYN